MAPGTRYTVRVALIVALGGFLMGFDASVISGVVGFIELEFELSKIELGWAVSSLTLTATLAMMVSGPLSDRIGRRKVLFLAAVVAMVVVGRWESGSRVRPYLAVLVVVLCTWLGGVCAQEVIFTDGLESGDTSAWSLDPGICDRFFGGSWRGDSCYAWFTGSGDWFEARAACRWTAGSTIPRSPSRSRRSSLRSTR